MCGKLMHDEIWCHLYVRWGTVDAAILPFFTYRELSVPPSGMSTGLRRRPLGLAVQAQKSLPSRCQLLGSAEPRLLPRGCLDWSIQTAVWGTAWQWWGATTSGCLWGTLPSLEMGQHHPTVEDETKFWIEDLNLCVWEGLIMVQCQCDPLRQGQQHRCHSCLHTVSVSSVITIYHFLLLWSHTL